MMVAVRNASKRVSILMAFYDNVHFVEDAVKSAVNQTYGDTELIVVDDCSPSDDARSFIAELAKRYGFVLSRNEKNLGASKSFQKAFSLSSGDYVSILSHDDMYAADKLEICMREIHAKNLDAVYCNGAVFQGDPASAEPFDSSEVVAAMQKGQSYVADLISSGDEVGSLLTQGALYSRRVMEELAWMRDVFLLDDWPFTIKVWRDYRVSFLDQVTYYYRLHGANVHKDYWRWFPARVQAASLLLTGDKRLDVLSYIFSRMAVASQIASPGDAATFALAASVFAHSKVNLEVATDLYVRSVRQSQRGVVSRIRRNLKKSLAAAGWRRRMVRRVLRVMISIVPVKRYRHMLRQRYVR